MRNRRSLQTVGCMAALAALSARYQDGGSTAVLPDPNALLTEISTGMKTVQTDIGTLRTNNEAHAKKLGELEATLTKMEERILAKQVSLPGVEDFKDKFSVARAFRAIALERMPEVGKEKAWSGAGLEKEIFEQTRKRVLGTETDVSGGYTMPTEIAQIFIDLVYANTALDKVGVTKLSNLKGLVKMNGLATGATAYWNGEGAPVTVSSPTFLQRSLRPHEITSWLKIQNQLLMRSPEAIEARMRAVLARTIALKLDLAGLTGTGGEYQPLGLAGVTGVNTLALGTAGAIMKFVNIPDYEDKLESSNFSTDGASFIFSHKVKKLLKQERVLQYSGDTGGMPYALPMSDKDIENFMGYKFATSQQLPTNLSKSTSSALTYIFYGLFREMVMADWGTLELSSTQEASDASGNSAWLDNQTWLKLTGAFDFGVTYPTAFVVTNDAATTNPVA